MKHLRKRCACGLIDDVGVMCKPHARKWAKLQAQAKKAVEQNRQTWIKARK